MTSKTLEEYRNLQDQLYQTRSKSPINEMGEDAILDKMDVIWDKLTQKERNLLDAEPARTGMICHDK
jgi:hypothetical protein